MAKRGRGRLRGLGNILLAMILTLFIFSLAVVLVLNFKWLYYIDITLLGLERRSGMDAASIRANYDALIQYNQFWFKGDLQFPSLIMSATGRIHFEEVKRIFVAVQYLCLASFVCCVIGMIRKRIKHQYGYLRIAGVLALAIPVALGVLGALDWERFFVTFHHIFFRNNFWLFDSKTDPVILILPQEYFMHCGIAILLCILIGSLLCFFIFRRHKRTAMGRRRRGSGY